MKLTNIKGVGRSTVKKLEKAGYKTVKDLEQATLEDITRLGISNSIAKKVLEAQTVETNNTIEYDINEANEFRIYAFKKSKDYDPDNLKESYDKWWKKVLLKQ